MSDQRLWHARGRAWINGLLVLMSLLVVLMAVGIAAAGESGSEVTNRPLLQASPSPTPTLPVGTFLPPSEPSVTEIPPYAPLAEGPEGHDVLNILLLGSDTDNPVNAGRTDAIMIVSLNRTAGTASLLSIPRDLFVYIPGRNMQRINTAFGFGENNGDDRDGYTYLKDTILYNLGIRIDFYARVDFNDFRTIIDALGGVEMTVDCALQDWRLKEPDLDLTVEDNWELFTLPVGVHMMDGDLSLWYARSRRTSSDFDRGRRQQDLMRAVWRRLRELGLLNQLPALWGQLTELVDTDMQLADVLGLVPLALSIDSGNIAHYTFRPGQEVQSWQTPGGSSVQLPITDGVYALVHNLMLPPTENRLVQSGPVIEVVNGSGYLGLDQVAADTLAWEGFVALATGVEPDQYRPETVIYDYSGRTKDSPLAALLAVLRLPPEAVIVEPDADRTVDYRVVLGWTYRSCTHAVLPPVPTPTPEPQTPSTPEATPEATPQP